MASLGDDIDKLLSSGKSGKEHRKSRGFFSFLKKSKDKKREVREHKRIVREHKNLIKKEKKRKKGRRFFGWFNRKHEKRENAREKTKVHRKERIVENKISSVRRTVFLKTMIFVLVMSFLVLLFFNFSYRKTCLDQGCFDTALNSCERVSYIKDSVDATWSYKINGGQSGELLCKLNLGGCKQCSVSVEFLKVKKGERGLERLEGKKMDCLLPINSIQAPERDISRCDGNLKEAMQEMIIQRMHNYILNNVGQIAEELKEVF